MNVTNIYSLPTINVDISNHPFIKDDLFKATVNFPPGVTPIDIFSQYCERHNIYYISL